MNYTLKRVCLLSLILCAPLAVSAAEADMPAAHAYIISPQDGDTVPATFTVQFGLKGYGVAPAGTEKAGTGHHHLVVDGELPPLDMPMDKSIRHFGGGQTETTLTLEPGTHTLQLILGDHMHRPHSPPVLSPKITVHVAE